ncbi:hypothetical protein KIH86_12200 [Paenibacillus sp. HN-1]|uniref:hypothetical protein n=1 Tax=Paenibacillus TaxID=44249 RepID=UPI001CA94477|nr:MULTISPECIES: hypothetical protein [Paenibacillus]MBY9081465.1 hypothetical protein [Paenibacillus sp. CGMCC 1.18879]MBY9084985.1 hypothetical protein [Paenibacillus sinensis]
MKRDAVIFWSAITLAAIGLVSGFLQRGLASLQGFIIPVVMILLLFLLYKYPPGRLGAGRGRQHRKVKPSQKTMAKVAGIRKSQPPTAAKRKTYPFRVIEGSKGKNDDEQLPKYH